MKCISGALFRRIENQQGRREDGRVATKTGFESIADGASAYAALCNILEKAET